MLELRYVEVYANADLSFINQKMFVLQSYITG